MIPELRRRVGESIKEAREARGLSLSDLARQSGTAKATLSALEAGRANPTLETLWALTAALRISLGELIDPPAAGMSVVRASEGTVLRGESVVGRIVSSFESGANRIEIYEAQILNRRQISPAHARGVTEHLVVTRGRLRVGPVDDPVELRPGDYLRMSPVWPHLYQGLERDTHMVLVMQFPK